MRIGADYSTGLREREKEDGIGAARCFFHHPQQSPTHRFWAGHSQLSALQLVEQSGAESRAVRSKGRLTKRARAANPRWWWTPDYPRGGANPITKRRFNQAGRCLL